MKRGVNVLAGSLALLATSSSHAEFSSGNELAESCRNGGLGEDYCLGYILGLVDGHNTMLFEGIFTQEVPAGPRFCVPSSATAGQLRLVVEKYLSANPERLHLAASSLVLKSLAGAFPCSNAVAK